MTSSEKSSRSKLRGLFGGVIIVYFIIALEVLIMISPFAVFFYAARNPVLLFLGRVARDALAHRILSATHGLAARVVPSDCAGRWFGPLPVGAVVFLVRMTQVYFHQFFRRDPAIGGLYHWIRHPQYLALEATGLGLAILWPRFLTIVLWVAMTGLYYLLARDEERRMVSQFGDQYRDYVVRTGMFVPRSVERSMGRLLPLRKSAMLRSLLGFAILALVAVGGAFALRTYTVAQLPLWSEGRITAMAVLPGDSFMLEHRMPDVLELPEVKSRLDQLSEPVLVYVIPQNYVMQGMIADTGPKWRLFQERRTLAMITDWIAHPFRHLEGGDMAAHHGIGGASGTNSTSGGMVRRLIFLRLDSPGPLNTSADVFGITTSRVPLFFADVDMHNLTLLDTQALGPGTGWGRVPTPMF